MDNPPEVSIRIPSLNYVMRFLSRCTVSMKGLILGLLLIQIAVLVVCLGRYPAAGSDDIWSASTAHTLITSGRFGRLISSGAHGSEVRDYFPPVNTLLISASYLMFGFGVWQTKVVALIFGLFNLISSVYAVRRITGSADAASMTGLLLATNVPTISTWQSGRYDSPSIFFITAAILYALCGIHITIGLRHGFVVGFLTGLACITYYPFGIPFVFTAGAAIVTIVKSAEKNRVPNVLRVIWGFMIGGILVGVLFLLHIFVRPDLFYEQIVRQLTFYRGESIWENVFGEMTRYREFMINRAGLAEMGLAMCGVWYLAKSWSKRIESKVILICLIIWLGFLTIYGTKESIQIAFYYPLVGIMGGLVYAAFLENKITKWPMWVFKVAYIAIFVFSVLKIAISVGTVAVQWKGRDYSYFSVQLRNVIPHGANVIGPGMVWYALVEDATLVRTISQGGRQTEYFEEPWINDPAALASVSHIVLRDGEFARKGSDERFHFFRNYVNANFVRRAAIRMPFIPLPWAPQSPYDVDVYVRNVR